ncbi:hypothetical protein C2G38_2032906 [Gigaspora rosea]|uniref:Peptidase S1 domain-containing protein n=1 Tax=Gigaspora rosea TaxID=44941 RepID=A0A397VPN8_9GLOM|nr:hypothetical protein C2G38_2032906 [Gigaspora rosea]
MPLIFKNKIINNGEKNMVNTINPEDKNVNDKPFTVGILFVHKNSIDFTCTASVISTDNRNIGITVAHCFYDWQTRVWADNLQFCPGYNHGKQSCYKCIAVSNVANLAHYTNDHFDYGILKFDYNGTGRLQDQTGCFDWGIQPKYPVEIVTYRYLGDGDMDCVKGYSNLCS